MRIKHKANVLVSSDPAGKDKLFALDDASAEVVLDGFTEISSGVVVVAAQGEFDVPFGDMDNARGLFVKATGDFTLALNAGPDLTISRGYTSATGRAESARALMEALLTAAHVENPATTGTITVTWCLWGDPTT